LSEITSIRDGIAQLDANVAKISSLHTRSLNDINADGSIQQELDSLAAENRTLSNELKDRIQRLHSVDGQDDQMRKNTTEHVRSKFVASLQNYQRVEQDFRAKSRQNLERQVKIVKPDATPQEVSEALSHRNSQIFTEALMASSRYQESRLAYNEVQSRQQELRKLEQTLLDLNQLFIDMGALVAQQEEPLNAIQAGAIDTEANTNAALKETETAVKIARALRKKRWICFFIFLFVIVVLAIVLGVVFGTR